MTFNGVLDVVDQSKTISEVGDLFVENPVDINGQSLTVMNTPLYKGLNGTLGKNFKTKTINRNDRPFDCPITFEFFHDSRLIRRIEQEKITKK